MSQDIRTNQKVSDPSNESIPLQPWSVDAYADKLMDELFSDIDRMLEGGSKLPTEATQPEYVSLQPLVIPPIGQAEAAIAPEEKLTQQPGNTSNDSQTPVDPEHAAQKAKGSAKGRRFGNWFDKLLLGLALTSVAGIFILWLASQNRLNWQFRQQPVATPVAQPQISESDSQFIKYMLRSLEAIDRKAQASKQLATAAGVQPQSKLPQVPVPSNVPPPPNPAPKVIEKIYIPVYPPFPLSSLPAPSPALTPSTPQAASASASPKPVAPSRVATSPKPVPKPQVTLPPPPAPAPKASVAQHTLVGVVNRGRPAALFEINGVTQRIHQGESIGNGGWTLVTVAKDEAIIRRNGEVRSVYVGQKF